MAANHGDYGRKFARAVADLVHDGHSLTVIHGQGSSRQFDPASTNGRAHSNGNHPGKVECAAFPAAQLESRGLVALLAESGVTSIGLCATDAGLVQLRRHSFGHDARRTRVEAARLHSRWLEIICSNKAVPILSNLCFWDGAKYLIDPDQMAAVCAVDWNADALIYVTEENGVPGEHGSILRWLDIESGNGLKRLALSDEMRSRLESCAMALRHGVRRVRILPLCNVDCLSSFYFSSIEYGTELIAVIPHI